MRRIRVPGWLWILGICGTLLWVVNSNAQPVDIVLDNQSVFTNRERSAVAFPHMLHIDMGIECRDCHHRFKNGENVVDEFNLYEGAGGIECAECHKSEPGFRYQPDLDASRRTLQQAYHRMCIGCHRRLLKENKEAGPVTCGICHPRSKEASRPATR